LSQAKRKQLFYQKNYFIIKKNIDMTVIRSKDKNKTTNNNIDRNQVSPGSCPGSESKPPHYRSTAMCLYAVIVTYVCMYVTCVYIYTYIYVYTYIYIYIHAESTPPAHGSTALYVCVYVSMYVYTYVYVCMYVCMHVCMHVCDKGGPLGCLSRDVNKQNFATCLHRRKIMGGLIRT
jgi:hypothetical protein